MRQVNIHDAKTHLSKLIEEVESGEEIVIARAGTPVARLTGMGPSRGIEFGILKGKFTVPDDFGSPLPADLLEAFSSLSTKEDEN